jgi:hypothetical protein
VDGDGAAKAKKAPAKRKAASGGSRKKAESKS